MENKIVNVANQNRIKDNKRPATGAMTRNYLTALVILAVLVITSSLLLQAIIATQEGSAAQINISGRQRMLSQRIALFSLRLADARSDKERSAIKDDLKEAIDEMEVANRGLTNGDKDLGLPDNISKETSDIFFKEPDDLNNRINQYLDQSRELAIDDQPITHDDPHLQFILSESGNILRTLDKVVDVFQKESDSRIAILESIDIVTLSVISAVIIAIGFFLFRPMVIRIDEETNKLVEAFDHQHRIASILQQNLVPEDIPQPEDLEIGIFYQSATKEAEVGGDFYDVFRIHGNKWAIAVGDVAGHGIDAATETARVKYILRDRSYSGDSPDRVLYRINEALYKQHPERFTALTYCVYDPSTSTLKLANAGNPYPYLLSDDRFLEDTGLLLSVERKQDYPLETLEIKDDELLIMYTDGLTEVRKENDEFGKERVGEFVKNNKDLSLDQLLEDLIEEARRFSNDNLTDDILVVGLRKKKQS